MTPDEIESNLHQYAEALGVSTAKLRAIYTRGVTDCMEEGYPGLPSTYGLARVQRFTLALQSNNCRMTPDADLFPGTSTAEGDDRSYEISDALTSSWPLIFDTLSHNGSALQGTFPAESIEEVVYDEDTTALAVSGTHGGVQWSCTLNLTTGEHDFVTNVD
jgi:hypothetical protein